jgi:divalent metal cation (Fe/Co/Zn/Cd) transporter
MRRAETVAISCVALGVVTAVAGIVWFLVSGGQTRFRRVPESEIILVCATALAVVGMILLERDRRRVMRRRRRRRSRRWYRRWT